MAERRRTGAIEPMRKADLDEVMDIERHAFRAPWPRDIFLEELGKEWARVDVLREASDERERIVAFVNYWVVRDEIHVLNVATHIDARRRGHATRLLEHVLSVAQAGGIRYIALEARRSNHAAIRLYRLQGFRPVGVRPNYYADDGEDAIVMLRELP